MRQHTKEPWKGKTIKVSVTALEKIGITIQLSNDKDAEAEANAHRIAVCVNECRGLPTDELEQRGLVAVVGTQLLEADERSQRQEREIHRLLAALKAMIEHEGTVDQTGIGDMESEALHLARAEAYAAISSAEGYLASTAPQQSSPPECPN